VAQASRLCGFVYVYVAQASRLCGWQQATANRQKIHNMGLFLLFLVPYL
jgi:hypothetical protein